MSTPETETQSELSDVRKLLAEMEAEVEELRKTLASMQAVLTSQELEIERLEAALKGTKDGEEKNPVQD